jgi:hypothetical protein
MPNTYKASTRRSPCHARCVRNGRASALAGDTGRWADGGVARGAESDVDPRCHPGELDEKPPEGVVPCLGKARTTTWTCPS